MLADAGRVPQAGVSFRRGDIADFPSPRDRPYDVIAANASLHWVGDHPALMTRLAAALAEHGQLAFQVPANFDHPSHTVAREVAAEDRFACALAGTRHGGVLTPEAYATTLFALGFAHQHVRLQVFGHVLPASEDVVEWVKGSLLTPYRERLEPPMYEEFLTRYRARLLARIGDQRPYFYPFKRILCWARRPG
jgi:trans-aconitate 2-methyltransferase